MPLEAVVLDHEQAAFDVWLRTMQVEGRFGEKAKYYREGWKKVGKKVWMKDWVYRRSGYRVTLCETRHGYVAGTEARGQHFILANDEEAVVLPVFDDVLGLWAAQIISTNAAEHFWREREGWLAADGTKSPGPLLLDGLGWRGGVTRVGK